MNANFLRLDEFIRELAISETELDAWYNNRLERRKELIPTLLPLVYQTGNELTAANGLILNRSKDLWGLQLLPRLVLARRCHGVKNNCSTLPMSWDIIREGVQQMTFQGKTGSLPSQDFLLTSCTAYLKGQLKKTIDVLQQNKITCSQFDHGEIWCIDEFSSDEAYLFSLHSGQPLPFRKNCDFPAYRVAIFF